MREVSKGRVHLECVASLPLWTSQVTGSDPSPGIMDMPSLLQTLRSVWNGSLGEVFNLSSPAPFLKATPNIPCE